MSLLKINASWQAVKAFFRHLRNNKPAGSGQATSLGPNPRRPQEPVPPFPYITESVSFTSEAGKVTLAGELTRPSTDAPCPAVVLVHGSGAHTRDEVIFLHKPFLLLADCLTRRGFAVLRYDKRGVGASTGDINTATTFSFADDAQAAVEFLKTRAGIDSKRIGVIGHSEGGMIAPVVASRSADVGFIVLLAGPGVTGEQILLTQIEALGKASGKMSKEQLAKAVSLAKSTYDILNREPDNEAAASEIQAMRYLFGVPGKALNDGISTLTSPWFRGFVAFDPQPILEQVKCPVLALNGDKDLQVLAGENLKAIGVALVRGENSNVTLVMVPGVNHLFQSCTSGLPDEYGQIEETISPAVLDLIGSWLEKQKTAEGKS